LLDVCNKISIPHTGEKPVHAVENIVLDHLLRKSWEKMTSDQRKNLLHQINLDSLLNNPSALEIISGMLFTNLYISRVIALFVAQIVLEILFASTITIAGGQALLKSIGGVLVTGPVGITISSLLAIPLLTGPAYRITLPAVLQIAYMRRTLSEQDYF
jgi:uncharacterized protein YaaW (UPF0174 family)